MIRFDHIAVAAMSLDAGNAYINALMGIDIPLGGQHLQMGTHNLVCALGPDTYFEVIAKDPDQPNPNRPRWFNLDAFAGPPCFHSWICSTPDLDAAVKTAADIGVDYGTPTDFQRGDLRWRFALRGDGTIPLNGAAPNLIEWPDGPHIATRLPDLGLGLEDLEIQTPHADLLTHLLTELGLSAAPKITQGVHDLAATLTLRNGRQAQIS